MTQSKGRCGMNRLGQLETGSQVVSNEDVEPGLDRSVNLAGHGRIVAHDVELGNQQTPRFCAHPGSRTPNISVLSGAPLPVGPGGQAQEAGVEPAVSGSKARRVYRFPYS